MGAGRRLRLPTHERRRELLGEGEGADGWAPLVSGRERVRVLAGCWNWAKQAENEGEGREMDSHFFFKLVFKSIYKFEF